MILSNHIFPLLNPSASANEVPSLQAIVGTTPKGEDNARPEQNAAQNLTAEPDAQGAKRLRQIAAVGKGHQRRDTEGKLKTRFPLAAPIRSHHIVVCQRNLADTRDKELTEHHDDGRPEGAEARPREVDIGRANENLVRQRIHQLAEVGDHVVLARQIPVQEIGNSRYNERPQSNARRDGDGAEPPTRDAVDGNGIRRAIHRQQNGEENHQRNAAHGDDVRQVFHESLISLSSLAAQAKSGAYGRKVEKINCRHAAGGK